MRTVAFILPIMGTLAFAADATPWQFGLSVQAHVALGTLKSDSNGHAGGGLSALATYRLAAHHALRPRLDLDLMRLREQHDDAASTHEETIMSRSGAGIDYLYYPGGSQVRGWFLSAGAGLHRWRLDDQRWDRHGSVTFKTQATTLNRTGLSLACSLGFQFTAVTALELRVSTSPYDRPSGGALASATGDTRGGSTQGMLLQLSGSFRW